MNAMNPNVPSFLLIWFIVGAAVLTLCLDDVVAATNVAKTRINAPLGYVMPWWAVLLLMFGIVVLWPFVLFTKLKRKLAK